MGAVWETILVLDVLLAVRVWVASRLIHQALDLTRLMTDFDIKHRPESLTAHDIEARYKALPSFGAVVVDLGAWTFYGSFPVLIAEARKRYAMLEEKNQG